MKAKKPDTDKDTVTDTDKDTDTDKITNVILIKNTPIPPKRGSDGGNINRNRTKEIDMTNSIVRVYHAGGYRPTYTQNSTGRQTPPNTQSTNRRKKRKSVIHRVKWGRVTVAILAAVGAAHIIGTAYDALTGTDTPAEVTAPSVIIAPADPSAQTEPIEQPTLPVEYIFRDGNGTPVDVQGMTNTWAAKAGTAVRYELTDAERWEVASVVTAESTGEPYAGMMAVAQCILQACEDDGIRPIKAIKKYSYTPLRPEPSAEALKAVQDVFDYGMVAADEPIKYFYAYKLIKSEWHESQDYVMSINGHKFFAEAKQ